MKKYYFLLIVICFCTHSISAQQNEKYWYFGDKCAVKFDTSGLNYINSSNMISLDGSDVKTDSTGELLFYTNGVTVYNKNNQIMLNGDSLGGHISSMQSVVIVPDPANDYEYYIFSTDATENQYQNGLCWSKVNMLLDNGLGGVTTKKNQLLTGVRERLTAIKRPACNGYWVLTYQDPYQYYAYPVTVTGIGQPVISTVNGYNAIINTPTLQSKGRIKVNPYSLTFVNTFYYSLSYCFEIGKFNIHTGAFTLKNVYTPPNNNSGIEFVDSNTLFSSHGGFPYTITKYKLVDVVDSFQINIVETVVVPGEKSIALGPDGILYIFRYNKKKLSAIINPTDTNPSIFIDSIIGLENNCKIGPPNGLQIPSPTIAPPQAHFLYSATKICIDSCISFINRSCDAYAFEWFFEGAVPAYSTEKNPQNICYPTSGNFGVMLVAHHGAYSDTAYMPGLIEVYASPVFSIEQNGNTLTCSLSGGSYGYQWYYNGAPIIGANGVSYTATMDGTYTLVVSTAQLCKASQSINVTVTGIADVEEHCEVWVQRQQSGAVQLKNQSTQEAVLRLTDISGRVVFEEKLQPGAQTQVMPATQGMYFLQISCGHQSRVMKIVGYP
jgi:hypothetical protein